MDSHFEWGRWSETSVIKQKFDATLNSMVYGKPGRWYSTVCCVRLEFCVQLWVLPFKRVVGKLSCNCNRKKFEDYVLCVSGKKTNKFSLKKRIFVLNE